jgi:hypothetical protein
VGDRLAIACILLLAGCEGPDGAPPDSDSEGGDGEEACTAPMTVCAGACVNLEHDSGNCGACGNVCPILTACRDAACVRICDDICEGTRKCCDGECVQVIDDRFNCGACGRQCNIMETCSEGVCKPTT